MTTYVPEKDKISRFLRKNRGKAYSAARLAQYAGVNPGNVSKRVFDLRQDGENITSFVKNENYLYQLV